MSPTAAPITVILNSRSGSAAKIDAATLQASFARFALAVQVATVIGPDIPTAAEQAASAGHALVAAGGDGTISTVAGVAVRAGRVFGVLPLGTLNHFARDTGIPLDLDGAIAVIAAGRTRPLDIGEVNGRTFVNNISLGMYPQLVRERTLEQYRGHSKWIAFAIALVKTWQRYPTVTVRMEVDGVPLVRETPFVFIGNGLYKAEGLGLGRRITVGGRLSVYMAPGVSRVEFAALPLRALAGRLHTHPRFEAHVAQEITIETPSRNVHLALDGEVTIEHPPLRCGIHPHALETLLPEVA
jgi:diacylglycerol kinase family enzyme